MRHLAGILESDRVQAILGQECAPSFAAKRVAWDREVLLRRSAWFGL